MSASTFRPRVEQLDGRCLPSANPAVSIGDVYLAEGNSGQTAFVFAVNLSKASSREVSVNFATRDGTAAAPTDDYVPTAGTLTFARGETTKTITVLVNGDTDSDGSNYFFVDLSVGNGAKGATATGTGMILDDDYVPPDGGGYDYPGSGGYPDYGYGESYGAGW